MHNKHLKNCNPELVSGTPVLAGQYKILEFNSIDSTNTYCLKHFDNLKDKTAVSALEQTAGRGRFTRTWVSDNYENIYLSFVLKPQNLKHIENLTQYLSVITTKVIETYGVEAEIKYPNDVLVNGKKVCGILCESSLKKNVIQGVVLGIGVNLNMPQEILDSIDRPATSLNIETGQPINRQEFLNALVTEFFKNYNSAIEHGFCAFKEDYLKRIKFLGKTVWIQQRDGAPKEEYTALKIDDKGNLIVKTYNNEQKTILSGDLIL